jgi:ABC-type antimicrobial peptide transport system permease subunit
MLLACANVASLMLSRTVGRQREMAVRAAVGARRWQLIRQLLVESVVLGLVGGVLGLLIAVWSKRVIAALVPEGLTSSVYDFNEIGIDWLVFGFTLALSLLTGIIFDSFHLNGVKARSGANRGEQLLKSRRLVYAVREVG